MPAKKILRPVKADLKQSIHSQRRDICDLLEIIFSETFSHFLDYTSASAILSIEKSDRKRHNNIKYILGGYVDKGNNLHLICQEHLIFSFNVLFPHLLLKMRRTEMRGASLKAEEGRVPVKARVIPDSVTDSRKRFLYSGSPILLPEEAF